MKNKILIIGKIPPPIGGVSIHIQRLLKEFENDSIKVELLDYSKEKNIFVVISKIRRCKIIHIHLSRKLHRLIFILFFRILFKKVVVTFHGKYTFDNKFDVWSLKFSSASIVLNELSYNNALKHQLNSVYLIGAFIPPPISTVMSLKDHTKKVLDTFKSKYEHVFCTNAWNIVYDSDGEEIYGGSILFELFEKINNKGLIFSDPEGKYSKYLLEKYGYIPNNIHFITYRHDFVEVIIKANAYIRSTTTDGDSLSVNEALFLKKDVIASNVVDRPRGCILYESIKDLYEVVNNFDKYSGMYSEFVFRDNVLDLSKLYLKLYDVE